MESQLTNKVNERAEETVLLKQVAVAIVQDSITALKVEEERFKLLQKERSLTQTRLKNAILLENLENRRRRGSGDVSLDATQEFQLAVRSRQQAERHIHLEHNMTVKRMKLEHNLLEAKIQLQKAESSATLERHKLLFAGNDAAIQAAQEIHDNYVAAAEVYITGMAPLLAERERIAGIERDTALETLDVETKIAKYKSQRMDSFGKGSSTRALGGGTGSGGIDFAAGIMERQKKRIVLLLIKDAPISGSTL